MIKLIGDGGHAKVLKNIARITYEAMYKECSKTIIAVGDNKNRKKEFVSNSNENFTTLIHPSAVIASDVEIGEGTVIMAGVIIQPSVKIGRHVILNTGCTIDHDCIIEDFVHIAPGVHLCGGCTVGEGALMGVGSCAVPGAKIEAWSLVKAGSVAK